MDIKVLIGLPSQKGEYNPLMTRSLDAMIQHTMKQRSDINLATRKEFGTLIFDNRNRLVRKAVEVGATHLMFIDSDMVFDKDALLQLLACDRDIVGGLCTQRTEPFLPVAKRRADNGLFRNVPVAEIERGGFMSDLDAVGAAFLLVRMGVFDRLADPWFAAPPCDLVDNYRRVTRAHRELRLALKQLVHADRAVGVDVIQSLLDAYGWELVDNDYDGYVLGEDVYFCDTARVKGFDVCLDTSLIIGHIGEHVYSMDDCLEYRNQREENAKIKDEKVGSVA